MEKQNAYKTSVRPVSIWRQLKRSLQISLKRFPKLLAKLLVFCTYQLFSCDKYYVNWNTKTVFHFAKRITDDPFDVVALNGGSDFRLNLNSEAGVR